MPYQTLKKTHPEYDPEYIQKKIDLINRGLPLNISQRELEALEATLRGAKSFYIDLLLVLEERKKIAQKKTDKKEIKQIEKDYIEEAKNLAGTAIALRQVDVFRLKHGNKIT